MNRTFPRIILSLSACVTLFLAQGVRAACLPLPSEELRVLDEEALRDSESAIQRAQDRLPRNSQPMAVAQLYAVIAEAHQSANRFDQSAAAISAGLAKLANQPADSAVTRLQLRFAITQANIAGSPAEHEAAAKNLTQLQSRYERNSLESACLRMTRGALYGELDHLELAIADELTAYDLARSSGWPEARAGAAFELATIYERTGLLDDARSMINEVIEWAGAGNRRAVLAIAQSTRGLILVADRQFDEALQAFDAARAISLEMGSLSGVALTDLSRCDALIKAAQFGKADGVCADTAREFREQDMSDMLSLVQIYQARIDIGNRRFAAALSKYAQVLADPEQMPLPRYQAKIYRDRSMALEALGRHAESLSDLRRYVSLTADADLAERALSARVLNARFKTESFVAANNALQREILAQRQATRLAQWLAGIALLVSLLLGGLLMLLARHRRNSRRQDLVLRTLASNAPDTLLLLDAQGRIEFANRPLFSESELPQRGQSLTALMPSSAQLQVDAALNRVIHDGTAVQLDVRLQDSNGALRHFEQSALPILEANRVVGATLRSTDVTQRRRLEERLITQSQVLETMSEGVILLSESHRIDYANRAFVEMIGGSHIDVRSLELSALGLDARHLQPAATQLETTLQCRDGRERRVAIACTRLALHDRNWLICVVQDVTETHRLELEVLNVAIRERDRFSSDLHEGLGQELTGIALLLESLRRLKTQDTTTLDERLAEVILHVNRTIQISRDVAHGLSPIQIERGSLGAALARLAVDLSSRLRTTVNCRVDIGTLEVELPVADYLYRSAREAISNAMRHGGATDIDIDLAIRSELLVLSITDNGTGMDVSTGGSGLGLRMIMHRARLIGATVKIEPTASRGTAISIAVPLLQVDA